MRRASASSIVAGFLALWLAISPTAPIQRSSKGSDAGCQRMSQLRRSVRSDALWTALCGLSTHRQS